ncbi:hypothetical protein T492DRAFT_878154 [Pavlovales sp. CCMP2436]|nr:hypothetical protein T492DRAFT_878154 [Pavlovales sp. CCMP2436]
MLGAAGLVFAQKRRADFGDAKARAHHPPGAEPAAQQPRNDAGAGSSADGVLAPGHRRSRKQLSTVALAQLGRVNRASAERSSSAGFSMLATTGATNYIDGDIRYEDIESAEPEKDEAKVRARY